MNYIVLTLILMLQTISFKQKQLENSRVKVAYDEKEAIVRNYFERKRLAFENFKLFIRAFKKEQKVEVWIQPKERRTYELLQVYDICASSGVLGPKRREGDEQVPEGIYYVKHFNPLSNFYLSLGLDYPNASDAILSDSKHPGSHIYIHGNCVTIGCIPITDDKIKELYVLAVEAKNSGQLNIPVHIFPAQLDSDSMRKLEKMDSKDQVTINFLRNLRTVYLDFEKTHVLPVIKVNQRGEYYF